MSDGTFHAYIGLLVLSAVILSVFAVRGFGQPAGARVVYGLLGAGFLGYAGYLVVAAPETVRVLFYAFAVPVVALVHGVRSARAAKARRIAALQSDTETAGYRYGPGVAAVATQPFPPPPPSTAFEAPVAAPARVGGPLPSGLPRHRPAPEADPEAGPQFGPQSGPPTGPPASPVPAAPARSGLAAAYGAVSGDAVHRHPARPSGLPPAGPASFAASVPAGPRPEPAADGRHRAGPGQASAGYVPFRLGPDDFVDPNGAAQSHAEPAAPRYHAEPTAMSYHAEPAAPRYHVEPTPPRYHAEPTAPRYHAEPTAPRHHAEPATPRYHAEPTAPADLAAGFADRAGRHARGHAEQAPGRHRSPDAAPWPPTAGRH